jgi:hypothetical protein
MTKVEEEKDQSRRADKVIKHRAALCRLLALNGHVETSSRMSALRGEADTPRPPAISREAANDPERSFGSIHSTCLLALVTDWAVEAWYRPSIA